MMPGPDPYAADGSRRRNVIVASVLGALAVGALVGIGGMRLLDASRRTPGPVLAANAPLPAPVLARTAPAPPPIFDAKASSKAMPADVRAWLEHLERIERKRINIITQANAQVLSKAATANASGGADLETLKQFVEATDDPMNAPDPKGPVAPVSEMMKGMSRDGQSLQTEYDSMTPPDECRNLGNIYRNTLRETVAMIDTVSSAVEMVNGPSPTEADQQAALAKVMSIGEAHKAIDQYGGESDTELGRICSTYETRKWFSISKDIGGTGSLSLPGATR